jgi:hypothetical protein
MGCHGVVEAARGGGNLEHQLSDIETMDLPTEAEVDQNSGRAPPHRTASLKKKS